MPTDPTPEPTEARIERLERLAHHIRNEANHTGRFGGMELSDFRDVRESIARLREQQAELRALEQERDTLRRQLHAALSSSGRLPLTKTLDPADFEWLTDELRVVDAHFTSARAQHKMRRWEYAMALRAQRTWRATYSQPRTVYDVGGAGSPFRYMAEMNDEPVRVIDPDEPIQSNPYTLAQYLGDGTELGANVFCLSVLEHVDDLDQFLYHLSCLVAPGGLLFLTTDCWDQDGPDTAHFHWMRKRIFSVGGWKLLAGTRHLREFALLGDADWAYHGHQLYGSYSFASLALVKRS